MPARIAFRCDAGPSIGAGHVMRSLALAEELQARGHTVEFLADVVQIPWLAAELARRAIAARPAPADRAQLIDAVAGLADAVVIDSYLMPAVDYLALRDVVALSAAMVDGELRGACADVLIDQNIGAEQEVVLLPGGTQRLAGLDYALIRREIAALRPSHPSDGGATGVQRVLVVFGGTDALGLAPTLAELLVHSGRPLRMEVVAARPELRDRLERLHPSPGQQVTVIDAGAGLAERMVHSDLVVGAAGSSAWEMLVLGTCAALVCVADNQAVGYERLIEAGAITGLGTLAAVESDDGRAALAAIGALLDDPALRMSQAATGWHLVDGRGAARIADELEARLAPDLP